MLAPFETGPTITTENSAVKCSQVVQEQTLDLCWKQLFFDMSCFKVVFGGGMGELLLCSTTPPEATLQEEGFITILAKSDHRLGRCLDLSQMQFVEACVVKVETTRASP